MNPTASPTPCSRRCSADCAASIPDSRTGASNARHSSCSSPRRCRPYSPRSDACRTNARRRCCAAAPTAADRAGAVPRHPRIRKRQRRAAEERNLMSMNPKILQLGSTSARPAARSPRRTASVSSSTASSAGRPTWWPKVLKRDILIGHEAVDEPHDARPHRPLERGLLKEGSDKDVEAVRELLEHLLRLVGVSSNGKVTARWCAPSSAFRPPSLRTNKQYLRNSIEGDRRQPDDRQRAVRGGVRPERAAARA